MAAPTTSHEAEHLARRSDTLAWAVRAGLVGYALLHLLVAWVAVRLVVTHSGGNATGRGALAQLADETAGRLTLVVMAVGFAALVVWQLIAAAVGFHGSGPRMRVLERGAALCRAAVWAYLAVTTTELTVAGGSGGGSPTSTTAAVMTWPGGAWIVAFVGIVVASVGLGLGIFGWRTGFIDQIHDRAREDDGRRVPIVLLGRIGYVAKGVALVVVGVLLVWAAWTQDPQKSGGLDRALVELAGRGLGEVAVFVVAAGLACFGLFLLARARHLSRAALTS